jgi:hypothetical protein
MESVNQIRQLDFFYNQDRLQKTKQRVTKRLKG